jgi:hypothetical protein
VNHDDRRFVLTVALMLLLGALAIAAATFSPAANPCSDGCRQVVIGGAFVVGCSCRESR